MKIVRQHTAALCILGLVSGVPVLANQAGTNVVHTRASVKIRTLAESGTCTQAPHDARENIPFRYRMLLHGK
jgi:hypothetical protein